MLIIFWRTFHIEILFRDVTINKIFLPRFLCWIDNRRLSECIEYTCTRWCFSNVSSSTPWFARFACRSRQCFPWLSLALSARSHPIESVGMPRTNDLIITPFQTCHELAVWSSLLLGDDCNWCSLCPHKMWQFRIVTGSTFVCLFLNKDPILL